MRFAVSLTSLVLFSVIVSFAQSSSIIQGIVRNGENKEELVGATLYLLSDKSIATITDANGKYTLLVPVGKQRIVCTFISMQADTFWVNADSSVALNHDVLLKSSEQQLQTVVVSAGKFEQKLEEITVSMEVLKPTLIEHRNTVNIKTALEQTPGLNILDGEPQIRGGSGFSFGVGSRVATLIDGIPVMAGDAGRTEWNFIPTENIEQVEIIKGASSVCYGSSALSGTINIRTAYPKDKPITKVNLYSGLYSSPKNDSAKWWKGMNNFSGFNFLHAQKFGKIDLVLGGMASYDHGFIGPPLPHPYLPIKADTITNSDVAERNGRFNFNFRYRPSKISGLAIGVNGNFMLSHSNFSLVWNDDTSGIYRAFPGTMTISDRSILYVDPFVSYTSKNGFKHDLKGRYFYTNNQNSNNQSNESTVTYYEYQFHKQFPVLANLNVTGGIVLNKTYSHAALYAASGSANNTLQNYSVYSQLDKKIWNVLNLSLGVRGEYFKINAQETVVQPIFRSGMNIKLSEGTFLRYSYGQGYRFPTITEKFILTSAGGITIFPNDSLVPETSTNQEVGLKQGFKIRNFKGFIDVAAFWQEYRNTIEYIYAKWSPDSAGFKFVNTGNTRVRGVEVSLGAEGKLSKNWSLSILGGYTYTKPEALDTAYVFAKDRPAEGFTQTLLTFANTSTDTNSTILKYRFQHLAKLDIELTYKLFSIGGSWRYYSFMKNIDKTFYDLDEPYLLPTGIKKYRQKHHNETQLFDARVAVQATKYLRIACVATNLFNLEYSLRPLKIEAPRTIAIQLALKL
ncbi:MAG: TonB-dependent receptor [Bacteroidetes bacterium]|nr:TonB-dependent receptor [Bacteroidota bacterium]